MWFAWLHLRTGTHAHHICLAGVSTTPPFGGEVGEELEWQLGMRVQVRHRFACEVSAAKRAFIVELDKPDMIFAKVEDMILEQPVELLSGDQTAVPEVVFSTAGFVCKTLSPLNSTTHNIRTSA